MKRLFTIITMVLLSASVFAQAPESMSYQAVVRDNNDNLMANAAIGMQISILQGSLTGSAVFVERHFPTTNANGLVSLEIGSGTLISGSFTAIDWENGPYFIKTETDPTGGNDYALVGVSQLLSVPYALHAKTADNGITTAQSAAITANTAKGGVTAEQATVLGNTSNINTGDQDISGIVTNTSAIAVNTLKTGITTAQSAAITANTAKVGYTEAAVSANTDVVANTAKVGYTEAAISANTDVTANTAKVGYTEALVSANSAVVANSAKIGITSDQAAAIVANTDNKSMVLGTTATTALAGNTTTITSDQATEIAANTLKVSYTQPIYIVNTNYAELGGYVIAVRDGGKHGLVVAMQNQGKSSWYEANDLLSDANNHDVNGAKFMDWRLPTKRELNLVYNQISNIGGFSNLYYWSSTGYDSNLAWVQDFFDGTQANDSKYGTNFVRAVRAF